MPPAPPMFSITTCWPSTSLSRCPKMRAMVSTGPPAAYATTMVIGRDGQSCAGAGVVSVRASASATNILGMIVSSLFGRDPGLLDDLRPHLDVVLDEGLQILGRAALGCDDVCAYFAHSLLHGGRVERRERDGVELLHDRRRRSLGRKDAVPGRGVEIGKSLFMRGGKHRKQTEALLAHHGDRLHGL